MAAREGRDPHTVKMVFTSGPDRRRYNAPRSADEIAAIFVGDEGMPGNQELCIYPTSCDALSKIPG